MAIFSNQATLTYNGIPTSSNIAYGEILDVLTAAKTSVEGSYAPGELITYAVTLRNTGSAPLTAFAVFNKLTLRKFYALLESVAALWYNTVKEQRDRKFFC